MDISFATDAMLVSELLRRNKKHTYRDIKESRHYKPYSVTLIELDRDNTATILIPEKCRLLINGGR